MGEDVLQAARRALAGTRRHTKRRAKPLIPVKDWATYPHEFVPIAALSQRWGEATQTIRKWIRNGLLTGFKFGGGVWKVKTVDAKAFEEKSEFKIAS